MEEFGELKFPDEAPPREGNEVSKGDHPLWRGLGQSPSGT